MLSIERQSIIIEAAKKNGAVKTDELIKMFDVSAETIRRDLLALEEQGVLRRVYGGAVVCGGSVPNKNIDERREDFKAQKKELVRFATELISEGDIIAIDEGTTALRFADIIAERFNNLIVVTHSLDVLQRLIKNPDIEVVLCGGSYLRNENALCGELTATCYKNLHVMKSFVFPSAISMDGGIMATTEEMWRIQKVMMSIADEVVVMADSSKFEKSSLYKVCPLNQSYTYITDSGIADALTNLYEENGYKILSSKN